MQHNTHVVVKSLPEQVMDIFWGVGWDNWSRVRLSTASPKAEFIHMAGIRLPFYVRIALSRYLRLDK
jgi:hypothetical protein